MRRERTLLEQMGGGCRNLGVYPCAPLVKILVRTLFEVVRPTLYEVLYDDLVRGLVRRHLVRTLCEGLFKVPELHSQVAKLTSWCSSVDEAALRANETNRSAFGEAAARDNNDTKTATACAGHLGGQGKFFWSRQIFWSYANVFSS